MLPNVFLQRNHLISDTKQAKIQKCNCRKTRERQTYSGWYGRIWALSTWYSHRLSPIQVLPRHYPTYLLTSEKLVLCWLCDRLEICPGWYICKWWQFWFLIPTKMEKSTSREFSPHTHEVCSITIWGKVMHFLLFSVYACSAICIFRHGFERFSNSQCNYALYLLVYEYWILWMMHFYFIVCLFFRWALWYFKNDKSKSWTENLRLISKFDTVEDFWA